MVDLHRLLNQVRDIEITAQLNAISRNHIADTFVIQRANLQSVHRDQVRAFDGDSADGNTRARGKASCSFLSTARRSSRLTRVSASR